MSNPPIKRWTLAPVTATRLTGLNFVATKKRGVDDYTFTAQWRAHKGNVTVPIRTLPSVDLAQLWLESVDATISAAGIKGRAKTQTRIAMLADTPGSVEVIKAAKSLGFKLVRKGKITDVVYSPKEDTDDLSTQKAAD